MTKTDEKATAGSDAPKASDTKTEATEPSVKAETAKEETVAPTAEAAPDSATVEKKEGENSTGEAAAAVATEPKPEPAASSEESKPATGETPSGENATAGESKTADAGTPAAASAVADSKATTDTVAVAADGKKAEEDKTQNFRLNGASKKRFRWLTDHGYDKDEAARLAKDAVKVKELRDKVEAEEAAKAKQGTTKVLSVAAKRRVAWLLRNGHTEEEAMELVQTPSLKRARPDGGNVASAGGPPSKLAKTMTPTGAIRIAVATKNFPVTTLTNEQSNTLKAAILKQVVQQKDSALKPRFENCIFVGGYLLVLCSDQPTVKFLQQTVPKLELWKDASLKVVNEKNLQKSDIYYGHFGDSANDSDKEILSFVESQNDGVNTAKWAILGRKPLANKQTIELSFTMDNASAKALQKLNYEVNYKFAKVTLRKKNKPADANRNNNARGNGVPNRNGNGLPNRTGNGLPNRTGNGLPNRNLVPRNSFVPIWDNNLPKRGNFNNRAASPPRRVNYDQQRNNRSFGGNSVRNGSNQYDNGSRNRGNGGNSYGGGNQSSGGRPYSLVDSLYEQLKRTVNVGSASNSDQYVSRRSTGGGGSGGGSNGYNQNSRNGGGYSSSGRSGLNLGGNRNFFTSSRLGFF